MDALRALADAGRLDATVADDLAGSYRLYRTIEHRLQMIDDQQTHDIPKNAQAIDRVAHLHGLADGSGLLDLLRPHVERTGRYYDALIAGHDGAQGLPRNRAALEEQLEKSGFADAPQIADRVEDWRSWKARALRSPSARKSFEMILPDFLTGIGSSPDPASALQRFDGFLDRLPSGAQFFTLLEANPNQIGRAHV